MTSRCCAQWVEASGLSSRVAVPRLVVRAAARLELPGSPVARAGRQSIHDRQARARQSLARWRERFGGAGWLLRRRGASYSPNWTVTFLPDLSAGGHGSARKPKAGRQSLEYLGWRSFLQRDTAMTRPLTRGHPADGFTRVAVCWRTARLTDAAAQVSVPGNYPTIQAAINAVPNGTTIDVQPACMPKRWWSSATVGDDARRRRAGATIVDAAGRTPTAFCP